MMRRARDGGYAVGYFESWNIESLYGVVEAAEQARAPVIIGFNGEFLSRPERAGAGAPVLVRRARQGRRERRKGSMRLHLQRMRPGRAGPGPPSTPASISSCLPTRPPPYDDYVRAGARSRRLRARSRRRGRSRTRRASGGNRRPSGMAKGEKTDPQTRPRLSSRATGVDLLAVSVGNVHVSLSGRTALDLDRSEGDPTRSRHPARAARRYRHRRRLAALRRSPSGVAKVNYGTGLKQRYLAAVRRALDRRRAEPARPSRHGRAGRRDDRRTLRRTRGRARTSAGARIASGGHDGSGRLRRHPGGGHAVRAGRGAAKTRAVAGCRRHSRQGGRLRDQYRRSTWRGSG